MSRYKLHKYQTNLTSSHLIQADTTSYLDRGYLYDQWGAQYFHNDHPIILELGCGKAEHSVYGATHYPDLNRIGIDIKGDRLSHGAKIADQQNLSNIALLRVDIRNIALRFAPGEVGEILIPYPDPRPTDRDARRRLTHPRFLQIYEQILSPGGYVKCKTDDQGLYTYTCSSAEGQGWQIGKDVRVGLLAEFPDIPSQFSISKGPGQVVVMRQN